MDNKIIKIRELEKKLTNFKKYQEEMQKQHMFFFNPKTILNTPLRPKKRKSCHLN